MHPRLVVLGLLASASVVPAADVSGNWIYRQTRGGEVNGIARVMLSTDGEKVAGTLGGDTKLEGTFRGGAITLIGTRLNGQPWATLEGHLEGDELSGSAKINGDDVRWIAKRVPEPGPAQTRQFEPTVFQRFFSSAAQPVLEVNSGDTIRTWTVDSGGIDAKGVRRTGGGNPQTGPFYVRGAVPGDVLEIKLNRIRLNRNTAISGRRIIPEALLSAYLLDRTPKMGNGDRPQWKLDREAGFATPANPSEHLKNFKVPLRPFLGCIAVAPPQRESYQTGWLGAYGGNLDYNALTEGATVYLPVYHEGALLFLGDGHAAQGDGEVTGDALETSMDVEVTVTVRAGQILRGPLAENDEFLMAMGIGNSLSDALQVATTTLAAWLERDYKLTPNEAALVLGSSIRYDIAGIADPQMHIVAKLSKATLAMFK